MSITANPSSRGQAGCAPPIVVARCPPPMPRRFMPSVPGSSASPTGCSAMRTEAEDVVQDAWIRWQTTDRTVVRDAAAFLATTTTRLAIHVIQSARARRETTARAAARRAGRPGTDPSLRRRAPRSAGARAPHAPGEAVSHGSRRIPAARGVRLPLPGDRGGARAERGERPATRQPCSPRPLGRARAGRVATQRLDCVAAGPRTRDRGCSTQLALPRRVFADANPIDARTGVDWDLPAERTVPMSRTIVLVHGAFAESASWDGVIDPLVAEGHRVVAAANPLRGLAADAAAVSDLVRTIEGPVVLVAHSYGGAVISNVDADAGEIAGLVYVNGFAPEPGENCFQLAAMFPGSMLGEADGAAGPAQRRNDRLLHRSGQLPRHLLPGRPRAAGRADGRNAAPRHPGGARRTVGRASAVEGRAVVVPDRRGGPHHPRRRSSATWPSAPARSGRSRSRARRTPSPSRVPTRRCT